MTRSKWNFFKHALSTPFIYAPIIAFVILDIFLEIYHRICFPIYNLPTISRNKYIRMDRHKLSYLTWREKLQCVYCGYANGLLRYVQAIAAETEKYWCPIRHRFEEGIDVPPHHKNFPKYGDEKEFRKIF